MIGTLIESSGDRGKSDFQVCFFSENTEFKRIFEIGWKVLLPRSRDALVFHSAFLATRCLKRLLPLSNDALGERAWDEQALPLVPPHAVWSSEKARRSPTKGSMRHNFVKCKNLVLEFL